VTGFKVHIKEGVELEPSERLIVSPRFQTVANANSPHRPIIDRVDGRELREVDGAQLRRRLKPIELQNRGGLTPFSLTYEKSVKG
jgi:hypothetical protein